MLRPRRAIAAVLLASLCAGATAERADGASDGQGRFDPPIRLGVWHVGGLLGYGEGVNLSRNKRFIGEVRFFIGGVRVGRGMSGTFFPQLWLRGRVELVAELSALRAFRPRRGHAFGGSILARYNFVALGRLVPFVEAGSGLIYLAFNNVDQSDGFSFILEGGAGAQFFVTDRWSVVGNVRFHHISNAGIRDPNPGINDVLMLLGLSYYY